MTIWTPDISSHQGPRYLAIAEAISIAIDRQDLEPGEKLPPQRDLAWRLGVTVGTVGRGYMIAEQRGLVTGEVGRGTFVRSETAQIVPPAHGPEGGIHEIDRQSGGGGALLPRDISNMIDLSLNMAVNPWQTAAFAKTLSEVAADAHIGDAIRYMPSAGHIRHREAIAGWIERRGVNVSADQIVLTAGAQHGLALAVSVLSRPGDPMMIESLTYPGLLDTLRLFHRRPEPLAMDEDGVRPDALVRHAKESGARVAVLVPTVQNPTACVMSLERRREIVAVARANDLIIVEDDVYGDLDADAPPTLQSMAPDRVIYLSSASKSLGPGLRCGWAVLPPEWVGQFTGAVYATAVTQPATHFEVIKRWIEEGVAEKLVERLQEELRQRQEIATRVLGEFELSSHPSSYHVLMHLPEGWRGGPFAEAASARGIRVTAVSSFAAAQIAAPRAVRISVAAAENQAQLEEALLILRDIARSGQGAARAIV